MLTCKEQQTEMSKIHMRLLWIKQEIEELQAKMTELECHSESYLLSDVYQALEITTLNTVDYLKPHSS